MAYEPQKWVWGLIPAAVLWIVGTAVNTGPIKRDLAARAQAALPAGLLNQPGLKVAGRDVDLSGQAFVEGGAAKAVEVLKALPGVRLVRSDKLTTIPETTPYVWSAKRDAASLSLAGSVPNPDVRAALTSSGAMLKLPSLSDTMGYARGKTDGLVAGAVYALGLFGQMTSASAEMRDGVLSLSGTVPNATVAQAVKSALGALPAGVTLGRVNITSIHAPHAKDPADPTPAEMAAAAAAAGLISDANVCSDTFKQKLLASKIEFDTGSDVISMASHQLLRDLALTSLRCATTKVEIDGYTDSQGEDAKNLVLSQDRADAVVEYLTSLGVPAERVTALGFGAANPVASNDTDEGRAQNRRIEFKVKQ